MQIVDRSEGSIPNSLLIGQSMMSLPAHDVQIEFTDNVLLICIIFANKYTICGGIIEDNVRK